MTEADIPLLINYWFSATPQHLLKMGVDVQKMPSTEDFAQMLRVQLATPLPQRRSFCIIWEINGQPVGHCNTNPTTFGKEATMHLHLWNAAQRKNGFGHQLLQKSIDLFFKQLELQVLFCEPYALNEAPNRTLAKAGFQLEKEYVTVPGFINFEQPVKRWYLTHQAWQAGRNQQAANE